MEISEKEQQRRARQRRQSLDLNRQKLAYTIPELVRDSGIGRSKIYEQIACGHLKIRKLGKRTLVLQDDAIAWLQSLPAA